MAPKSKTCASSSASSSTSHFFKPGTLVEINTNNAKSRGSWFTGKIVHHVASDKFTVEYDNLMKDKEGTGPLREEIGMVHIRPSPPKIADIAEFKFADEVDAFYNDSWWVGLVSKVLGDSKYIVYFWNTDEEVEFQHSQLRLHQDWVEGKWLMASKALSSFET